MDDLMGVYSAHSRDWLVSVNHNVRDDIRLCPIVDTILVFSPSRWS
jgi:hypothetical protein